MGKEEVAVLLATYNGEKFLREQIDSLCRQSCRDFRCYVHDDGSTDGTVSIIEEQLRKGDQFVVVPGPSQGGAKKNFLFLLNNVDADYYMFCDQDDIWREDKIEKTLAVMKQEEQKNPGRPVCVYSNLEVFDGDKIIAGSFYPYMNLNPRINGFTDIIMRNVCWGCTVMINRTMKQEILKLTDVDCFIMHDWICSCIAAAEGTLYYIDDTLIKYRQHGDNAVGATAELSGIKKTVRAVKDVPAFFRRKKYYVERPRRMAASMRRLTYLDPETRQFLKDFARIGKKRKSERIAFYKKYGLFRQDENKAWQLFWI